MRHTRTLVKGFSMGSSTDQGDSDGEPERIVLLGGGGHASDVLGLIEFINSHTPTWTVLGVADDSPDPRHRRFEGRGVAFLGRIDEAIAAHPGARFLATVGFPEGRRSVAERAERAGLRPATVVDPRIARGTGVQIAEGCVVLDGVHLSPLCRLGRHVYVSTQAIVGHDTIVGDFSSLMPACAVSGDVVIGEGVLIGLTASISQGIRIGRDARVGAGAVVVRDVEAGTTVTGIPAKPR
jgi:sugar O-acyltransferase (sialic acid O-acetyltransferase NeuD family)